MAYFFSLKSKPGLIYEREEGDGTVDMKDFFNTGHNFNKSSEILKDYYSIKDKNKPYIVLY